MIAVRLVVLEGTPLLLFCCRRVQSPLGWKDLLYWKCYTDGCWVKMLALLLDKGIDVVNQLFSLIIQRDLHCLQKLEPSNDASLLPKSLFEDLILMFLEEQSILSQSLYFISFLPFRNVGWRSILWFLDHIWQGIDRWCVCWGLIFVCWAEDEFLWWVCWFGGWSILQKGTSLLLVSYNNLEANHRFRITFIDVRKIEIFLSWQWIDVFMGFFSMFNDLFFKK